MEAGYEIKAIAVPGILRIRSFTSWQRCFFLRAMRSTRAGLVKQTARSILMRSSPYTAEAFFSAGQYGDIPRPRPSQTIAHRKKRRTSPFRKVLLNSFDRCSTFSCDQDVCAQPRKGLPLSMVFSTVGGTRISSASSHSDHYKMVAERVGE
jgi:hypothetical protein